jgi:hypothetical protein
MLSDINQIFKSTPSLYSQAAISKNRLSKHYIRSIVQDSSKEPSQQPQRRSLSNLSSSSSFYADERSLNEATRAELGLSSGKSSHGEFKVSPELEKSLKAE